MKTTGISRRERGAGSGRRSLWNTHALPPALEWMEDAAGRCPRITAIGNHSLLVENHTGIAAFCDTSVALNSRAGLLRATGQNLSLCGAREGALIIRGDIRRIDLPCRGGDAPDAR